MFPSWIFIVKQKDFSGLPHTLISGNGLGCCRDVYERSDKYWGKGIELL